MRVLWYGDFMISDLDAGVFLCGLELVAPPVYPVHDEKEQEQDADENDSAGVLRVL